MAAEQTTDPLIDTIEQRIAAKQTTIPIHKVVKQPFPDRLRIAEAELVRLREFVQFVADHSNDPGVVAEAKKHGAE